MTKPEGERLPVAYNDWTRQRQEAQEKERQLRHMVERQWTVPGHRFSILVRISFENTVHVIIEGSFPGTRIPTAIVNGDVGNVPTSVLIAYAEVRRAVDDWVSGKSAALPDADWKPFAKMDI